MVLAYAGLLGHVLPQDLIDARLPSTALVAIGVQHLRVNSNRLIHLAGILPRAASTTAQEFLR
jgi:hypothetical protein